jgi:hypothetical protein
MMSFIRPRLRTPVRVATLGTVTAAAIVAGQGWGKRDHL